MDRNIITSETKIYHVVKQYPELLDVLVEQVPKFKKMKNKLWFNSYFGKQRI